MCMCMCTEKCFSLVLYILGDFVFRLTANQTAFVRDMLAHELREKLEHVSLHPSRKDQMSPIDVCLHESNAWILIERTFMDMLGIGSDDWVSPLWSNALFLD